MDLNALGNKFIFELLVYVGVILFVFLLQRVRWRRNKRLGRKRWGFYPSSAALGTAFQQIQTIAQPEVENILEEKRTDDVDEDHEGGPEDPTEHLNRQLKQIQRGKRIHTLRVRRK